MAPKTEEDTLEEANNKCQHFYLWPTVLALVLAFIWHLEVTGRWEEAISTNRLNITGDADPDCLIFNRVPKVGSQTIMNLIGNLKKEMVYGKKLE